MRTQGLGGRAVLGTDINTRLGAGGWWGPMVEDPGQKSIFNAERSRAGRERVSEGKNYVTSTKHFGRVENFAPKKNRAHRIRARSFRSVKWRTYNCNDGCAEERFCEAALDRLRGEGFGGTRRTHAEKSQAKFSTHRLSMAETRSPHARQTAKA